MYCIYRYVRIWAEKFMKGEKIKKDLLMPSRVRNIEHPFGWIPRRFITGGYIRICNKEELLLYFFLGIVSDKYGLSFYGDNTICMMLGISQEALEHARQSLQDKGLIGYKKPLYQVLSLPEIKCNV